MNTLAVMLLIYGMCAVSGLAQQSKRVIETADTTASVTVLKYGERSDTVRAQHRAPEAVQSLSGLKMNWDDYDMEVIVRADTMKQWMRRKVAEDLKRDCDSDGMECFGAMLMLSIQEIFE